LHLFTSNALVPDTSPEAADFCNEAPMPKANIVQLMLQGANLLQRIAVVYYTALLLAGSKYK
jgi:hypothetical protein